MSSSVAQPSQRGMLQERCRNVTSATLNIAGNVAATFPTNVQYVGTLLQHSYNIPAMFLCPPLALQRLESCRNVAGMFRTLQEYCRNVAGMLRECCKNVAGILQTLQEHIEY
ncbi:hypothetical protein PV325_004185 [Microctonus aethiopoides]|nr:hypothetical protein PV325_004185 [Microctonus aethiopoides]